MLCQLTEARKVERLAVLVCADVIVCLSLQEVCYHKGVGRQFEV